MAVRIAKRYLESVELKPSSELIPDEYFINSDDFIVDIFYGSAYEEAADKLATVFTETCKFTVRKHLFDNKVNFLQDCQEVKDGLLQKSRTGRVKTTSGIFTIILCNGDKEKPGHLLTDKYDKDDKATVEEEAIPFVDVWDPLLKLEPDVLNRKPKLFLFQSHYPSCKIETDGTPPKRLYDTAAPGADILIISRTIDRDDSQDGFITQFCEHIKCSGEYADLFEIATFSTTKCRPIIVSTLTARFFTKRATYRDSTHLILDDIKKIGAKLGVDNIDN